MTDHFSVTAMTSTKRSTRAFLSDLLSRFNWMSTSSRFPELIALLSTNAIPTACQAAQLKASIEVLNTFITVIQSDIDLLRSAAASLETKMERLKDIRRDYRAALSPIRCLPTEILVEIQRWTYKEKTQLKDPGPYRVFRFNVFKTGAGPWYLGQVCSSWRDAVRFPCPEIWSTLEITWPCMHSEKEDSMIPTPKKDIVALLDRALERSQNRRLEFLLQVLGLDKEGSVDEFEEPVEISQYFDLLLKHSNRWGSIELALVPSFLSRLSLVCGRVDRVEDVYLTCIPGAMSGTMDAFEIAPKLKTLDISGMDAEAHIPFPADNLVLFSDGRPLPDHDTVPQCLDIIASAPNLFDLSYHHYSSLIPLSSGPCHPQIVHQSLQRLSTSLGALIDSLVVPGLNWMTLVLVVRSHCSLTILIFIDAIMDET